MQVDVLTPTVPAVALAPACLNCAATLAGPFCARCGQSAVTPEHVTFRSLWTDFRVNKLGLDRGFFVTVRDVLVRPGVVAAAFVEGRRRTYVHPLTFLFVAYGLYTIVFGLVEAPMMAKLGAHYIAQAAATPGFSAVGRATFVTAAMDNTRFNVTHGAYLSILTVLPFGFLLRRFLPGSGRTVAECAVFALTIQAGVTLVLGFVFNPLYAWTGSMPLFISSFVVYFVLTGIGAATFFDRGPRTIVRAFAAQGLAIVLNVIVVGISYGVFTYLGALNAGRM